MLLNMCQTWAETETGPGMQGAQVPLDYITITGAVTADPNQAAAPGVATVGGRRLRSVAYANTLRQALCWDDFQATRL